MSYGSATTAEHVSEYFERIYPGRASPALIEDFENRYRLVGYSPLVEITIGQAAQLQKGLGSAYVVRAGMRYSAPYIDDAVGECVNGGATKLVGVILSPQFSSFIMEGYKTAFMHAADACGVGQYVVAGTWADEAHYVELLAKRTTQALKNLQKKYGVLVPVVFTTHSLPQRVVEKDPSYLMQLQATIAAVLLKLDHVPQWYAAYQSAGHTPEVWLKPDVVDVLKELRDQKAPAVLIVPIQFLSDHLEVLYDLDIAAKKQCDDFGIAYHRIELPNTDPLFLASLAATVHTYTQDKTSMY